MMKRILSTLVTLAWALWLGGLVGLFVTLPTIFKTPGYTQEQRGAFAARLFPVFERMQLIFAAVALVGTAAWWMAGRARVKLVLFTLFALAALVVVVETTAITPRIETLRVNGQRGSAEFERMHQLSSRVYTSGSVLVLIAGFLLPSAIRADAIKPATPRTSEETDPA
jgi:hypothetical protein